MSSKRKAHGKLAEQILNKKKGLSGAILFGLLLFHIEDIQNSVNRLVSRVSDVQYLVYK